MEKGLTISVPDWFEREIDDEAVKRDQERAEEMIGKTILFDPY